MLSHNWNTEVVERFLQADDREEENGLCSGRKLVSQPGLPIPTLLNKKTEMSLLVLQDEQIISFLKKTIWFIGLGTYLVGI